MNVPNKTPEVTIVMSAYNSEKVVGRAIESVINQTFTDWCMLIVDDASTDGTRALLYSYAEKDGRITVIHNSENMGLAASLNKAISLVDSPLIARMDDDDECLPERLELQVSFMQNNPDVDVCGTGAFYVGKNERHTRHPVIPPERHDELINAIFSAAPFIHPTVIYTKEFIDRAGGYDEDFRRSQDKDLWLRTYKTSVFHNLQEPLIYYTAPQKPKLVNMLNGVMLYYRAAKRDGELTRHLWHIARPIFHYMLISMRLKKFKHGINPGHTDERQRND